MATLTIRNLPDELIDKLKQAKQIEGKSINNIVAETLMKAFGIDPQKRDLSRYTTWTESDFDEFTMVLEEQRQIDDDLWK